MWIKLWRYLADGLTVEGSELSDGKYRGRVSAARCGFASVVAAAMTALPAVALFLFPGLDFYALRCDESCRVQTGVGATAATQGWSYVRDAWQWTVQFWAMAVPGVLAAVLFVVLLAHRRPRAAIAALAATAFFYAGYAVLYITGGRSERLPDAIGWLPYAVMIGGGIIAIAIEWTALENVEPDAV